MSRWDRPWELPVAPDGRSSRRIAKGCFGGSHKAEDQQGDTSMQLVELETQGGKQFWVNPAHIATVKSNQADPHTTDIYLIAEPVKAMSVRGDVQAIMKLLNDGLKA